MVRASHPDGVDAVLNLVLPSDRLTGLGSTLRAGGRLLTITFPPPGEDAAGRPDVTVTLVLDMAGRLATMRDVAEEAAAGGCAPPWAAATRSPKRWPPAPTSPGGTPPASWW